VPIIPVLHKNSGSPIVPLWHSSTGCFVGCYDMGFQIPAVRLRKYPWDEESGLSTRNVLIRFLPGGRSFTGVVNCDNWRAPTGGKEERKETIVKDLNEGNRRVMRALYLLNSPDDGKDRRMKGTGQFSMTKRKNPTDVPSWVVVPPLITVKRRKTHYAGHPLCSPVTAFATLPATR